MLPLALAESLINEWTGTKLSLSPDASVNIAASSVSSGMPGDATAAEQSLIAQEDPLDGHDKQHVKVTIPHTDMHPALK